MDIVTIKINVKERLEAEFKYMADFQNMTGERIKFSGEEEYAFYQ